MMLNLSAESAPDFGKLCRLQEKSERASGQPRSARESPGCSPQRDFAATLALVAIAYRTRGILPRWLPAERSRDLARK
jgi:hypothetical protein